jgi:hypothetical protein
MDLGFLTLVFYFLVRHHGGTGFWVFLDSAALRYRRVIPPAPPARHAFLGTRDKMRLHWH